MRCTACNKLLSDYESCAKNKTTREYLDLCSKCHGVSKGALVELETPEGIDHCTNTRKGPP